MSAYMDDDFWTRLADKLIAYGTGLYNIKKIKRLSKKAIKAEFYGLNSALRRILVHRYHHKETLQEIGNKLNMTPQGVRYHETIALDRILRSALRTPRTLPVHLTSHDNIKAVKYTPRSGRKRTKNVHNAMSLIDNRCCDRRLIKNVLTELSPRIISSLENGGYRTMQQLCTATPNNLKILYGIGPHALRKIQQAVKEYHEDNPRLFPHEKAIDINLPSEPIYTPISKRFPQKNC